MAALVLFTGTGLRAQVTIGDDKAPETFSALEIISNGDKGLRLPQMTTAERNALTATFGNPANSEAQGLQIFNKSTGCVDTWNGNEWLSLCPPEAPEAPTLVQNGWATVNLATGHPGGYGPIKITVPAGSTIRWYDTNNIHIPSLDGMDTWDPEQLLGISLPGLYTYKATSVKDGLESDYTRALYQVCGVRKNTGGWARFMCHSLGADQTKNPNMPNDGLVGHLYSVHNPNPVISAHDYNIWIETMSTITNLDQFGITPPPLKDEWSMDALSNPCPKGWIIPSRTELSQAYTELNKVTIELDARDFPGVNSWLHVRLVGGYLPMTSQPTLRVNYLNQTAWYSNHDPHIWIRTQDQPGATTSWVQGTTGTIIPGGTFTTVRCMHGLIH